MRSVIRIEIPGLILLLLLSPRLVSAQQKHSSQPKASAIRDDVGRNPAPQSHADPSVTLMPPQGRTALSISRPMRELGWRSMWRLTVSG
jgi:hypothetical protein